MRRRGRCSGGAIAAAIVPADTGRSSAASREPSPPHPSPSAGPGGGTLVGDSHRPMLHRRDRRWPLPANAGPRPTLLTRESALVGVAWPASPPAGRGAGSKVAHAVMGRDLWPVAGGDSGGDSGGLLARQGYPGIAWSAG